MLPLKWGILRIVWINLKHLQIINYESAYQLCKRVSWWSIFSSWENTNINKTIWKIQKHSNHHYKGSIQISKYAQKYKSRFCIRIFQEIGDSWQILMIFNSNSRYATFSFCEFCQGPFPPPAEGSAVSMRNTPWEPLRKHWAKGLMDLLLGTEKRRNKSPSCFFLLKLGSFP